MLLLAEIEFYQQHIEARAHPAERNGMHFPDPTAGSEGAIKEVGKDTGKHGSPNNLA